jgi:glycosyltransferase involved in cell wall biosynthesis
MHMTSDIAADIADAAAKSKITILVPVLDEEEAIRPFLHRLDEVFQGRRDLDLEILFVNDGSRDGTLETLLDVQATDHRIKIVDLSRNFGKEAALSAGLQQATGSAVVPIDVDLQDPPEMIVTMVEKWREGYEVVLARRIDRRADSWVKRTTAGLFYQFHNLVSDHVLPENVGDFRLMDRCVVDALNRLPETRRFMKGLFAWVGFRATYVDYVRPTRTSGVGKFPTWKLWNFAIEGVTSFSTAPLRIWTYAGSAVALVSFMFGLLVFVRTLIFGIDTPGYASLMLAITFFAGVQLIGIGILGEYIGRAYIEAKNRPIFIIRRIYQR